MMTKMGSVKERLNPDKKSCSVLEKSHIGAKSDFEIWAVKVFSLDQKKGPNKFAILFGEKLSRC